MYRILCFGDSNTWGFNPVNGLRFSENERWPGVLRRNLGEGFEVYEDGKNGRRVLEDSEDFISCLQENTLLDVIIIFLGINDLCFEKDIRVDDVLSGISLMLERLRFNYRDLQAALPEVVLMGAVPINETQIKDCLYEMEAEKVVRFAEGLRNLAGSEGCGYIDPGRIISSSELDGVHIEAAEHYKLGMFVGDYIRTFLINGNLNHRKH